MSLCMEVAEGKVDIVYGYCHLADGFYMFNVFFRRGGEVLTPEQVEPDDDRGFELLRLATGDLSKLDAVCRHHGMPTPTEIRMTFDAHTHAYDAQISYDKLSSKLTPVDAFFAWRDEVKQELG